jgi:hypothetical protein
MCSVKSSDQLILASAVPSWIPRSFSRCVIAAVTMRERADSALSSSIFLRDIFVSAILSLPSVRVWALLVSIVAVIGVTAFAAIEILHPFYSRMQGRFLDRSTFGCGRILTARRRTAEVHLVTGAAFPLRGYPPGVVKLRRNYILRRGCLDREDPAGEACGVAPQPTDQRRITAMPSS